jgi:hypothetical protein
VTEGKTIVEAEPRSQAAQAFRELASIASRERIATTTAPVERQSKNRRGLALLRKET